jgi:hypothetical protein
MDEDQYIWNAMQRGGEANWQVTSHQLPPAGCQVEVFTEAGSVHGFINPKHPFAWSISGKPPHSNSIPFETGHKWRGITQPARR